VKLLKNFLIVPMHVGQPQQTGNSRALPFHIVKRLCTPFSEAFFDGEQIHESSHGTGIHLRCRACVRRYSHIDRP
jgi:hypothetical protein